MINKINRISFLLYLVVVFSYPFENSFGNNGNPIDKPKVLLLNSYHKGFYWTDEITKGIEEALPSSKVDLHIEYLDTKRQFDDDFQELLTQLLKMKYSKFLYDLIIVSDNNAFDYLKKYKSEIAGNIPVVFCGVNYVQQTDLNGFDDFVGVNEYIDIVGNIELIKDLHPETEKIIVITDNTKTGKKLQEEVRRVVKDELAENVEIDLWYDYTAKELKDRIKLEKEGSIFLYTLFFRDKKNVFFEYDISAQMVSENSNVPVYGTWDFSVGHGIVGGKLTCGSEQGKKAGKLALQVLSGKAFHGNQISNDLTTKLIFDYNIVEKHKINLKKLNVDYEIVNQPTTFLYRNKALIRNLGIVFSFLVMVILFLMYGYLKTLRLKRQLSLSKTQLSSLITNMPGAVYRCIAGQKWKMVFLSPQIKNICGFDASDFEGDRIRPISSIIYPDDIEWVRTEIDKAIRSKKPWEINYRVLHKDGSIKWVAEYGRGIENEHGEIDLLDGLLIDITKRKVAEKERQKTEQKFEKVFDNTPVGVLYYNKEGVIVECNESLASLLGVAKEQLIGFDMPNQLKDRGLKDAIKDSLIIGTGYYSDYYTSVISGNKIPVKASFKGILDEIGIFSSGIGIIEDVTDQIKSEREILEANKRLKSTNDELLSTTETLSKTNKELIIALQEAKKSRELELANEELRKSEKILRIAHNDIKLKQRELEHLNTELKLSHDGMQQLNKELISANDQLSSQKEELEQTLQKLKDAQMQLITSEKMASVGVLTAGIAHEINNPLNYIQGGKTAIELFVEDNLQDYTEELRIYLGMIQEGIEKAVKIIRGLNHFNRRSEEFSEECDVYAIINNCLIMLDNQLKHRIEIEKSYTTQQFTLIGNEGRLHQLFLNILQNSSQAIVEKGKISISTLIKDGLLEVKISDNGCGIKENNLALITDPFYTTKPPGEGTGLGLSIAYSIVREHKGQLQFASTEGESTEVLVSIPVNC